MTFSVVTAKKQVITVLSLSHQDAGRIHALEVTAHSYPWSLQLIQSALQRYHCWGVQLNGQLVGFAIVSCVAGEAELLDFVVSPSYQGQGIGTGFMLWLLDWLYSAGKAGRFFLEVRESNEAAIAMYQSAGFSEVGVRPNYYPALKGREDAILMAIELIK